MAQRWPPRATLTSIATLGVPDTLDGRFDAIGLYVYLTIRRLSVAAEPGPTLAQAVFDAMFLDMDTNLREMGVGDMSVGKRNRAMWEAFHGRSAAYAGGVGRRRGAGGRVSPEPVARGRMPRWVRRRCCSGSRGRRRDVLPSQPVDAMLRGDVHFLPAKEAAQ